MKKYIFLLILCVIFTACNISEQQPDKPEQTVTTTSSVSIDTEYLTTKETTTTSEQTVTTEIFDVDEMCFKWTYGYVDEEHQYNSDVAFCYTFSRLLNFYGTAEDFNFLVSEDEEFYYKLQWILLRSSYSYGSYLHLRDINVLLDGAEAVLGLKNLNPTICRAYNPLNNQLAFVDRDGWVYASLKSYNFDETSGISEIVIDYFSDNLLKNLAKSVKYKTEKHLFNDGQQEYRSYYYKLISAENLYDSNEEVMEVYEPKVKLLEPSIAINKDEPFRIYETKPLTDKQIDAITNWIIEQNRPMIMAPFITALLDVDFDGELELLHFCGEIYFGTFGDVDFYKVNDNGLQLIGGAVSWGRHDDLTESIYCVYNKDTLNKKTIIMADRSTNSGISGEYIYDIINKNSFYTSICGGNAYLLYYTEFEYEYCGENVSEDYFLDRYAEYLKDWELSELDIRFFEPEDWIDYNCIYEAINNINT